MPSRFKCWSSLKSSFFARCGWEFLLSTTFDNLHIQPQFLDTWERSFDNDEILSFTFSSTCNIKSSEMTDGSPLHSTSVIFRKTYFKDLTHFYTIPSLINFTDFRMNFSCFHAFSTKKMNHVCISQLEGFSSGRVILNAHKQYTHHWMFP